MISRRRMLFGGAGVAGVLLVGYGFWPDTRRAQADRIAANSDERFLSTWIKVAKDGHVTVMIPHCDMGTGIFTALAQMAAEELDADWSRLSVETAPADSLFANGALAEGFLFEEGNLALDSVPTFLRGAAMGATRLIAGKMHLQTTGGSSAVRMTGVYGIRIAAAATRELLVKAASARLGAKVESFRTEMGRVLHASGTSFGFGELVEEASRYSPSAHPTLKEKSLYQIVGKSLPRIDIPSKVNGLAAYGMDVDLPGLCYGAIAISPAFGGNLKSVNEGAAMQIPGVRKVVRLEDAVIVIADRYWRARRALEALQPTFEAGANAALTSKQLREQQNQALQGEGIKADRTVGGGAKALTSKIIERTYHVPYLAHAAMEPLNATALYLRPDKLQVWAGTQDALGARAFCARQAKLSMDKVQFHQCLSGGAFGRRLPDQWNYLEYAIKASMAMPGVPVKLIFSREEDLRHDYYRPNVASRFRASLQDEGLPRAWVNDYTTEDGANAEAHIAYDVANQAYGSAKLTSPVPTGAWRSVESSWHGFFVESFIDELAHEAGRDAVAYRAALLKQKPRHLAVLQLAAAKSGWGSALPARHGRGVALFESFGSIVAEVAEVEVSEGGTVRVHRITAVADCGMAVNPDGFRAQIEGGIVFGLSAALYGAISIDKGAVVEANFPDYRVVRLADCPKIDVFIHESEGAVGGGGEVGTPPVAPALTNAIFAATGVRIRELPVGDALASSSRNSLPSG